jgi:hypothetical protein
MNQPRRLRDDPSAAPWLAERVRDASGPPSMPAAARARVGAALARELEPGARTLPWAWARTPWPLAAALALSSVAWMLSYVAPLASGEDGDRARLRPEPPAPTQVNAAAAQAPGALASDPRALGSTDGDEPIEQVEPIVEAGAAAKPERAATRAKRVPAAEIHARAQPRRARTGAQRAAPSAPWLAEARAALASDPERTLALIRTHRDPHAPVSPEVVELTILALEARRAGQSERATAQP